MFNRQILGNRLEYPPETPKQTSKCHGAEQLKLIALAFIDIKRYLRNKDFDIVWGYHPSETFPNGSPKSIF